VVLSGRVERGRARAGQRVAVLGAGAGEPAEVVGVEAESGADEAVAGGNARLVLSGVRREALAPGRVVAEPGSIAGRTAFRAEIYWLGPGEGGREAVITGGHRASFSFWGADVVGTLSLPADRAEVRPGEHADVRVNLEAPVALEEGLRFAVREGGLTVGAGAITEIVE
jgi:elongation factor Tu